MPEIIPKDKIQKELFDVNRTFIMDLAKVQVLRIEFEVLTTEDVAISLVDGAKIYVPLKGIIDLEVEKKRKGEEIAQRQRSIDGLQSRLSNETFVSKAPEEIIAKEKERLDILTKEMNELKNDLANLS